MAFALSRVKAVTDSIKYWVEIHEIALTHERLIKLHYLKFHKNVAEPESDNFFPLLVYNVLAQERALYTHFIERKMK